MILTPEELAALIASGEGRTLEFKRGLPRDEKTARTLAAFANTRGGILLVGVGDRGELFGAPHPRETALELREIAARIADPPIAVDVQLAELAGRTIAVCSVPLSPARPHSIPTAEGAREIVVRAGSSNRAASAAALRAMVRKRPPRSSLAPLERRALEWVASVSRDGAAAQSRATIEAFCKAQNIGRQRARRAFTELERAGWIVGHGVGARRGFAST